MLLRLPNLPAVPGDPLLGLLLAGAGGAIAVPTALTVMAAALSLYAFGLLLNDVADLAEDRRERPDRPLPAGRVSPRAAVVAALLLAALGLLLAWSASLACGVVAAVLLGAILCYTFWVRRWPAVALTVMGCCRGLSVLLGAAALGWPALSAPMVVVASLTMTGYTIALAAVALGETEHKQIGLRRFGPCVMVMAGIVLARLMLSPESVLGAPWVALVWANVAMLRAANHGRRLAGAPPPALVGKTIGCFVRDMTLLQAAFCALATSSLPLSAAVGSLWLVSWVLSRRFYGS
jgi:4-hydroxybenzoate polyprenyltransferase